MAYRRTGHVAWRRIGGRVVVVNLRKSTVLGLDTAGGAFWEALTAAPELAVTPGGEGAGDFLSQLEEAGVIERTDEASPAEFAFSGPPPAVEWQETLQVFAANCNWVPGQNDDCNASPGS